MRPGDQICFYVSGRGVIASATIATEPQSGPDPRIDGERRFPWIVELSDVKMTNEPVALTRTLRDQLDGFANRDRDQVWSWFVQYTHPITEHDFKLLTTSLASGNAGVSEPNHPRSLTK